MKSKNPNFAKSQQGIATILTVALVGIALIVAIAGTAYYLRMKQQAAVASHALTNAQQGAWAGVEVFRQYLEKRAKAGDDLTTTMTNNKEFNIIDETNKKLKVTIADPTTKSGAAYFVKANVFYQSGAAKSASTIQVVYKVNLGNGEEECIVRETTLNNVMNFYGDFEASGEINLSNAGERAVLNVAGNFKVNSIKGVKTINVLGDVEINGAGIEGLENIYTNGNVTLTGSGSVANEISAKGFVESKGQWTIGRIEADEYVKITNGTIGNIDAGKYIEWDSGGTAGNLVAGEYVKITNGTTIGNIDAGGNIIFIGKAGSIKDLVSGGRISVKNGTIGNIKSIGDIEVDESITAKNISSKSGNLDIKTWQSVGDILVAGNITCHSEWWTSYNIMKATSISDGCSKNKRDIIASNSTELNFIVEPKTPKTPKSATGVLENNAIYNTPKVNAYDYENEANYIFDLDEKKNIVVKLRNFNDVDINAVYRLAKYKNDGVEYWGGICELPNSNNVCDDPVAKISTNPYNQKEPITYNTSSEQWILSDNLRTSSDSAPNDPSVAPSVMLFVGDLSVGQGNYINTLLATGNIIYGGSDTSLFSPNYTDSSKVCNKALYNMPTNLCGSSTSLIPASIGNIALLAGSCESKYINLGSFCNADQYTGGNITMDGTANIKGNIIAGNKLITGGSTNIVGSILAAALKVKEGSTEEEKKKELEKEKSVLGGTTTIDLNSVADDKTTIVLPGSKQCSADLGTVVSAIKWARYL